MNQHQRRGRPQSGTWAWLVYSLMIAGLLALLGLFSSGCSQAITMRHPDGRTVNCGNLVFLSPAVSAGVPDRERQCIEDFRGQGFVRQP